MTIFVNDALGISGAGAWKKRSTSCCFSMTTFMNSDTCNCGTDAAEGGGGMEGNGGACAMTAMPDGPHASPIGDDGGADGLLAAAAPTLEAAGGWTGGGAAREDVVALAPA